jgi:hypothetical protein
VKPYSNTISLIRNGRGVYCIDTTMGCSSGMAANTGGCYGDCYAARIAKRYGHDFSKTVLRHFESEQHKRDILIQISKIRMPFIRVGASGDPSENWCHTFEILKTLSKCNTEIVIITRHWNVLTDEQLMYLSTLNICINTSISALDNEQMFNRSMEQYERIKPYCKSVLRIISCDFNKDNERGKKLSLIQEGLFKNEATLDTVFRPSKKNRFVVDGVVNVKEEIFNGKKQLASKYNRKTYMGKCQNCKEMCGVNIATARVYENKRLLVVQLSLLLKVPA